MSKAKSAGRLHRLSTLQVQRAGEGDHGDGGGLMLRVRGESATWVLRFTSPGGRRREMGLGTCRRDNQAHAGESLTAARDSAHEARALLRAGRDPIDERDRRRSAARQADAARRADKAAARWTLARCARDYHERVIEPNRTGRHSAQWAASLENHVPAALWHRPIAEIEAPELLEALLAIEPHERARNLKTAKPHETVRRVRQRLEAVFADAIFLGRCQSNPASAIKSKMREARPEGMHKGQHAALPYRLAPAFAARLRELPGTAARSLEFALLTAARTTEVLLAEWQEFDLPAGTWEVPASRMKARQVHAVFLSARAAEIVKAQIGQSSRWVFPSPAHPERPQSNMAMLAVLDRLGMRAQTTVHGLRATFSTWAADTAAARPDVVEACLAHREADIVRRAYMRASFDEERRALLAAWADYLARPAQAVRLVQA